mmetsp:Transcript_6024/g.7871  ORF Transcript_6024/g.7871 Transcript_6024/m.7871 type:complete len:357 (-) Transcript_6024:1190-2260(-)|eukprot:CAMPEP_0184019602 /NCGR_PEP_ID=MMETSP0954-20121128/8845_1 /TAXON_ID=627963 /ORGANISM="Aplanochytrium sp, Strain PBS07" /LENGTH=356 /DNA_ID=CAMNT_0026301291 /DNA_START=50 /DNA_END=1120 /DNA_ORIENTATION=-
MSNKTSARAASSFSLRNDNKTLSYLLPPICDWLSTTQEDEVDEDMYLSQLADGVVLCRVLSLLKESGITEDQYFDPVKSKQEAKHNLQLFKDVAKNRLYFPTMFKFRDFKVEDSDSSLYTDSGSSRVVECLVFLAKAASKHRKLRIMMPTELKTYVTKKMKGELTPPSVMSQFVGFGGISNMLDRDEDDIVFHGDIDSDEEEERKVKLDLKGENVVKFIEQAKSNRSLAIPVFILGLSIGVLIGLIASTLANLGSSLTTKSNPFTCDTQGYDTKTHFTQLTCAVDPRVPFALYNITTLEDEAGGKVVGSKTLIQSENYFVVRMHPVATTFVSGNVKVLASIAIGLGIGAISTLALM